MRRKNKYDIFQCRDCGHMIAYSFGTGDGHRCPFCGSGLFLFVATDTKENIEAMTNALMLSFRTDAGKGVIK